MTDTPEPECLCARCAATGPTCCHNTRIFLTHGDVARLDADGRRDYHEHVRMFGAARDAELDPAWRRTFGPDGRRRVLRHQDGDERACIFLEPDGCALDMAVRPLLCRLYPFDYDGNGIKGIHAHYCPWPENTNPPLLLALLAMSRDEAEQWRKTFYQEIEEEFPAQDFGT